MYRDCNDLGSLYCKSVTASVKFETSWLPWVGLRIKPKDIIRLTKMYADAAMPSCVSTRQSTIYLKVQNCPNYKI